MGVTVCLAGACRPGVDAPRGHLLRMPGHRLAQELEHAAPPQQVAGMIVPILGPGGQLGKHSASVGCEVCKLAPPAQSRAEPFGATSLRGAGS